MRNHMTNKVLEYGQAVCEQEKERENMRVHEPRTTEEQMRARDLLQLVLEFDEKVGFFSKHATLLSSLVHLCIAITRHNVN